MDGAIILVVTLIILAFNSINGDKETEELKEEKPIGHNKDKKKDSEAFMIMYNTIMRSGKR